MHKLLYLSIPAHGHLNPALPVLRELAKRGEQVIVYNTPEFQPSIEQTGALFRPYPRSELTAERITQLLQDGNLAQISNLLLRSSEQLTPFVERELARERPQAVVFDAVAIWGRIATRIGGVPSIGMVPHFIFDGRRLVRTTPRLLWKMLGWMTAVPGLLYARRRITRRYGKAVLSPGNLFPALGDLNILFTAAGFQPASPLIDRSFRFVGPSIDAERPCPDDFPFEQLRRDSTVYISLGTIHNRSAKFYRDCFATFGSYPAQFILSVGTQTDISALGRVPDNFIVRASVPQIRVLEYATAFVTHGGMNSIHEALYQGVPLLLIPHQIEQMFNAYIVEGQRAGIVLNEQVMNGHINMDTVRKGLDAVLSAPQYREGAKKVQEMLRNTGGYLRAADEIQAFVNTFGLTTPAPDRAAARSHAMDPKA